MDVVPALVWLRRRSMANRWTQYFAAPTALPPPCGWFTRQSDSGLDMRGARSLLVRSVQAQLGSKGQTIAFHEGNTDRFAANSSGGVCSSAGSIENQRPCVPTNRAESVFPFLARVKVVIF